MGIESCGCGCEKVENGDAWNPLSMSMGINYFF